MIDTFLVPEKTVVNAKGDGPVVDISSASNRVFLLSLNITGIVEQESLDVSIHGSADGVTWGPKPVDELSAEVLPGAASSAVGFDRTRGR